MADRRPVLSGQQLRQSFELHLDQIAVPTRVQKVHQGPNKKAAVGPKHHAVRRRQLGQQLLHERDDPVARVGAAGAKPGLEDFLGIGIEGQERMVGRGTTFVWVVSLRAPFLAAVDGFDTGVDIHPPLALDRNP